MNKFAIISTHPVQYYVPVFQLLSREPNLEVKVFYTYSQRQHDFYDKDFGREIKWDVPLLEGYNYTFVSNTSKHPGLESFKGIKCPSLIPEIKNWGASHVLIFGWNYQAHLKAMRYFKGKIPVWFRGDSTLLDEKPGIKKIVRRLFLRWVYSYVDKAFYVGTNSKNYFKAHGLKNKQLVFAPHAIDNKRFADSKEKKYNEQALQWRKQLRVEETDKVILFCGKLEPKKAPDLLLETFIYLKNNSLYKNIKLIFVGNGILEQQLRRKAQENESGDIHFIPFQNQSMMPIVYRLSNLFCLPSRGPGETWGLVVNEAMASGLPVLASSKVGSSSDLIKDGTTGYIFKSEDQKSLEEKIKLCLNSNLETMGMEAQKEIQHWSFRAIKDAILKELN